MIRRCLTLLGVIALLFALPLAGVAHGADGPVYDIQGTWGNTNLTPGDTKADTSEGQFVIRVRNVGDGLGAEDLVIEDELPVGLRVTAIDWLSELIPSNACTGVGTATVKCTLKAALLPSIAPPPGVLRKAGFSFYPSGYLPGIFIDVSVPKNAEGVGVNTATVKGGGGPAPVSDTDQVPFAKEPFPFGIVPNSFEADLFSAAYPAADLSRQASDRPFEFRLGFDVSEKTGVNDDPPAGDGTRYIAPTGALRTVEVTLPRGMMGNPESLPKCDLVDFAEEGATADSTRCPSNTQVGYLNVAFNDGTLKHGFGHELGFDWGLLSHVPIYNLEPPRGALADLGFSAGAFVQAHIYPTLDAAHHYAIKSVTPNVSSLVQVRGSEVTIWGVPGDSSHDKFRYYPEQQEGDIVAGAPFVGAPIRPFLTNPTDCGEENGGSLIRFDSYEHPGEFTHVTEHDDSLDVSGCDDLRFRFEPQIALQPTSRDAGGPTGLDVNLTVPQRNDEVADAEELYAANGFVKAIATPPMKRVVVKLPEGMTVSPSAADGLDACTPEQIGIDPQTSTPNDAPVTCPDASQYGTLRLKSPALPQSKTITGRVYVAQPYTNPFDSFLALYLAIEDPDLGLRVKLAGEVRLDPITGQITTEFRDLPQLPVSEVEMKVKGGLRAGLVNPQTCGRKTIEATFYSWQDPSAPQTVKSSYDITGGPGGTRCFNSLSERPFDPQLDAGTLNPLAGAFSPMEIDLTRADTDQDLSAVQGTAPPGLLASLRGATRCSDAQIAAAANPLRAGTEELSSSSCPASSQVGTVDAGAGVGQVLTYVKGKVYLAGPYRGAPLSGVAIVPAVAGPFDLGTVVTRAPAYVDPVTAQLTLKTDPLPLIFKGVPVRVRDIRVHLDRPRFTLNPTSCEEMHIEADLQSAEGKSKHESDRFQVGSCGDLGFRPRLALRLEGGTKRGDHPSLRAILRPREGDANIASASAALPRSAFLDQAHIRTICTRVQFVAEACPAGSIYGQARAFTPLLDEPLEGPVYLRSSNHNLPDLVVALQGPPSLPIDFDLIGRVDSLHGGIRTSFEAAPDAPVTKFVLTMRGGKKGLVVNSTNLCAAAHRAFVKLVAHNGRRHEARPVVAAANCGKPHRKKKH